MDGTRVVTTSGEVVTTSRRGYLLTAAVLLVVMTGGTLPIPLYVLYEQQMGFGPLGVTSARWLSSPSRSSTRRSATPIG